jgi:alpha/beta superfamily hydrolase
LTASILLSYPVSVSWALTLFNSTKYLEAYKESPGAPKLLILGDKDNFTGQSAFQSFVQGLPDPKTVILVKDADHFWAEHQGTLIGHVRQWIETIENPSKE